MSLTVLPIGMRLHILFLCNLIWLAAVAPVAGVDEDPFKSLKATIHADMNAQAQARPAAPHDRMQLEQSVLSTLESSTRDDPARAEQSLKQLLGTDLPDSLRNEVNAALDRIRAARAEQAKAISDQATAALQRAAAVVLKAQTARDLDATLSELRKVSESRRTGYTDGDGGEALVRVRNAVRFVQRWQDYLWAVEGGKVGNAISTLNDLAGTEGNPLEIGRSEILTRARSLEGAEKNQVKTRATPILQNIRTLDDLPEAVAQLRGDQAISRGQEFQNTVTALETIAKSYLAFKNGIATTLPTNYSNAEADPLVSRLRTELLLRVLPRILGVEEQGRPNSGETVEQYLGRMRATAMKAADYELLSRVIAATRQISFSVAAQGDSPIGQEYMAINFFREGQNDERAKRFTEAVLAYRQALRMGTTAVPAEFIGQRLAAIERDQPDEYKRSMDIMQRGDGREMFWRGHEQPAELKIPAPSPGPTALRTGPATPSPANSPTPRR